ncbi:hypothetical protein IJ076_00680, partial [Candidatus Saccharibacteria bacterium]|nr:hypothetical protein [Candidatus Saccharibacteria bacterium]
MKGAKKKSGWRGLSKGWQVFWLVVLLFVVVGGTILFVGLAAGWFSDVSMSVDVEYLCENDCDDALTEIDAATYEEMIRDKKSFVLVIDQGGCTTAERVKGFMGDYATSNNFKAFKMMFEEMKKTSLYEYVKYYPSVVLISKGDVIKWLRADSDEDAPMYNDYDAFRGWIGK